MGRKQLQKGTRNHLRVMHRVDCSTGFKDVHACMSELTNLYSLNTQNILYVNYTSIMLQEMLNI